MEKRTLLGSELSEKEQQKALARFVHRYTKDHCPRWIYTDGGKYPVQFASDKDWLQHTRFEVLADGRLDNRAKYCESNPTWPDNPELRKHDQS